MFKYNEKNALVNRDETIQNIVEDIENGNILIPDIQRGLVWEDEQKQKFLKTLIKKYPYGAIIFGANSNDKNTRFVVDGLQRLTTIIDIYFNIFRYVDNEVEEYIFEKIFWKEMSNFTEQNISNYYETIKEEFKWNFKNLKDLDKSSEDNIVESLNFRKLNNYDYLKASFRLALKNTLKNFKNIIFNGNFIKIQQFQGSESDISEIFQYINEQGTPLTEIDILKSKLIDKKIDINKLKIKDEIIDHKKESFSNLLGKFKDIIKIEKNDSISVFDLLFYITYDIFNNKIINKDNVFFSKFKSDKNVSNSKNNKITMEWFKINRFLLSIFLNKIRNHELENNSSSLESIIKKIFQLYVDGIIYIDDDKIANVKKLIQDSILKTIRLFNFSKINIIKFNEKSNGKNFTFNASESLLIISTIMKLEYDGYDIENDDKNHYFRNILKNIIKIAYDKPFGSGSNDKAYEWFMTDKLISDVNIIERLNNDDAEFNFENAFKVLYALIYIKTKETKKCMFILNPLNNIIDANIDKLKIKESLKKSIFNYFVFLSDDNDFGQISKNNIVQIIENEFFYSNCSDYWLREKYSSFLKQIFEKDNVSQNEIEELLKLRKEIIISYLG